MSSSLLIMQALLKSLHDPKRLEKELLNRPNTSQFINVKDEHGDSLLHFAARSHSLEILRILVKHGADPESVNEHGRRPLHEAIDCEDCVSYLVKECQVDVNAMKRGDWTPVMIAAMKGNLDIVKILVEGGALLDRVTKDGRTALYLAVQEGHFKMSEYLADQYPEAITLATKSGRWPIQSAATLPAESTVAFNLTTYLFSKAKVSLQDVLKHRDNSGRNILLDAAIAQNLELLKFLLGKGADPNDTDSLGRSMIHHAAMMGHLYLLEILNSLGNGHMIHWNNPDTWDQWTPLMHAAHQGELAIVQYLIEEIKVDKSCVDKQGRTALDIANIWNHSGIVSFFAKLNNNSESVG